MIIVWRGLGILVLAIVVGCVIGAQLVADKFVAPGTWQKSQWPFAAALALAAGLCFFVGRRLNKAARKDAEPRRPWTHDFFFLRMEWWAYPLAAVALTAVLTGWKPGDSPRAVKAAAQQAEKLATQGK